MCILFLKTFGHKEFRHKMPKLTDISQNKSYILCTSELLVGISVSHKHTLWLSLDCPEVASRLADPTNVKSLVTF